MRVSQILRPSSGLLVAAIACGCGADAPGRDATPKKTAAAPAAAVAGEKTLSADKRLIGNWKLDLTRVPLGALSAQFRSLVDRTGGLPDNASAHYRFDGSEMVLSLASLGSSEERRWYYEILQHSGDNLELQRHAPDGKKEKMAITVTDTHMRLHTGRALLELERVQ